MHVSRRQWRSQVCLHRDIVHVTLNYFGPVELLDGVLGELTRVVKHLTSHVGLIGFDCRDCSLKMTLAFASPRHTLLLMRSFVSCYLFSFLCHRHHIVTFLLMSITRLLERSYYRVFSSFSFLCKTHSCSRNLTRSTPRHLLVRVCVSCRTPRV